MDGHSRGLDGSSYGLSGSSYGLSGSSYGLSGSTHGLSGSSHGPDGHSHAAPWGLFEDRFGQPAPAFVVHAPGRVNLIGEHIDYSLLPVLPMAIQLRTTLTVRPREDGQVRLTNAEPLYADVGLRLSARVKPGTPSDWGDYTRGVAQALVRDYEITVGADIAVESDLPVAAGLSSSSALSCGVALALLAANGKAVDRVELAEVVARAERYTGTQGGGMDQAVILCTQAGYALGVSFAPLRIRPVSLPEDWVFLVAHSGVVAEKSGPAQATYNARTRECREALATVWAAVREDVPSEKDYRPLLETADPEQLLEVAEGVLDVPLLARFRHTVSEVLRVSEAEEALGVRDLDAFGHVMDASHQSLRDDYEVSTPELDRIVALAREAGAAGARVTGAGLGGAALILCTEAAEEAIRESLARGYYASWGEGASEKMVFRAIPSGGATVGTVGL